MFYDEGQTTLKLELAVENDLEIDNNGNFYVLTLIFAGDDDEPAEVRVTFEDIIDNLIDFYRDTEMTNGNIGYGQLYGIANELERTVDRLREVAGHMEGRVIMEDMFDYYESNEHDEDED